MRLQFLAVFVLIAFVSHAECDVRVILDSVVGGFANTAGSVARGVADSTGSVFGGIVNTAGSVLDGIAHTAGTVVKGTIDAGGTVVRAITDTTKTAAGAISDTAKTTWNTVRGPRPPADESVKEINIFKARNDVYGYSWTVRNQQKPLPKEPSEEANNVETVIVM